MDPAWRAASGLSLGGQQEGSAEATANTGPGAIDVRHAELPESERVQATELEAAPRTPTAAGAPAEALTPQPHTRTPVALVPGGGVGLGGQ